MSTRSKKAEIGVANIRDISAICEIEEACFAGDRLSRRSLRRLVQRPSASLLVLRTGSVVCAYAVVLFRAGSSIARLYSLAVHPAHTGNGYASQLIDASQKMAMARHCDRLRLEVRKDNRAAVSLYKRLGFATCGIRQSYYEDGMDAVRMQKQLQDVAVSRQGNSR